MRASAPGLLLAALAVACAGPPSAAGGAPVGGTPPPGRAAAPATVGGRAGGAVEPGALVWVAVEDAERTVLVDVARRRVVERYRTPGGPHNLTAVAEGTVAVALWASDRVALVEVGTVRFVWLGGAPHDVKAAGDLLVVANRGAGRVDRLTADGDRRRSVRLRALPHDLAVTPGGRRAWVTLEGSDDLAVVDLRRGRLVRYVGTGVAPHDLLFAPDGRLWVTDWEGALHVFRGDRLVRTLPLGVEAHHLAFSPDGRRAWVTDHGARRVYVLSVRPVRLLRSLPFPGEPHHVAVTADGRWAVVADHAGGRLVVYRTDRYRRAAVIAVGAGPHGVWAVPAS